MSERQPFYLRRRYKNVRSLIRASNDFAGKGEMYDTVVALLRDIAKDLSDCAEGGSDEAYALMMRCMRDVANEKIIATRKPSWRWPVVQASGDSRGCGFGVPLPAFSALKMFGYTVGRTDGWPQAKREHFLSDFMEMELPPVVRDVFGDEYGAPMTVNRLRKVANVISTNASNFLRNDPHRYGQAIADWKSDLEFLWQKYYIGKGLAFLPWPSVQ